LNINYGVIVRNAANFDSVNIAGNLNVGTAINAETFTA